MNDLSEQNEVLVQTVEELEREANERVEILESKLQKTSGTHKVRFTFFLCILPDPLSNIIIRCTLYTPDCRMKVY